MSPETHEVRKKIQTAQKAKRPIPQLILFVAYAIFLGVSLMTNFEPGEQIGTNFLTFATTMVKMLPFAFVLIGLFEVWVKRETIEKHLGEESGWKGYFWAVLLAGAIVGPLYVALPVAYSLYKKGATFAVIFTYIGASAICRVPMTTFEASFLGFKFTAIRLLVSLPLVILTSIILGKYLARTHYVMEERD
jgi:uncharacterized membrane protein YraQ (UPF0718 family)